MRTTSKSTRRLLAWLRQPILLAVLLCLAVSAVPAHADTRIIVRVQGGQFAVQTICALLGCHVQYGLGDPLGQVFLVTSPNLLSIQLLLSIPGVLDAEIDQTGRTLAATSPGAPPPALQIGRASCRERVEIS